MYNSRSGGFSGIAWIVGIVILLVGLGITLTNPHEHSSGGVITISDYEASIAKGDTLNLSHSNGDSTDYWSVIYDGDTLVTAHKKGGMFSSDHTGKLCGTGCSKELDLGWPTHLTMTKLPGDRVSIKWPWGWGYLRNH